MKSFQECEKLVYQLLKQDTKRITHIQGVIHEAIQLAKQFSIDESNASIASLLHDATKTESYEKTLFRIERTFGKDELSKWPQSAYHALSAVDFAIHECEVTNPDILNAIKYHTTGRKEMSLLEKIIFISDYFEPSRVYDTSNIRTLLAQDIDLALYEVMITKKYFFELRGHTVLDISNQAIDYYKNIIGGFNESTSRFSNENIK